MTSIRRDLLITLVGAILLVMLGAGIALYRTVLDETESLFDYQLREVALSLSDQVFFPGSPPPEEPDAGARDLVIQVWDAAGVRVFYSQPHRVLPGLAPQGFSTVATPEGNWRVYAQHLPRQVIQVAQPAQVRNAKALASAQHMLAPLLYLIPALALLTWIIVSRVLQPLNRVAKAVGDRTPKSLSAIGRDDVPEEVLPLVDALNDLLARLGDALATQEAFIADAAHELRTPVAALQLQFQLLERARTAEERDAALTELKSGMQRAVRAVQQLLTLARADPDGSRAADADVNLRQLLRQVAVEHASLAVAKHIDLSVSESLSELTVAGDPDGLRVLLANLVENAVRYTPPGGQVELTISGRSVRICDSGPGIAEAELERVFDRFYRGTGPAEGGSGLGLAIVKAIANRHGARVRLENRNGGGLCAEVDFPPERRESSASG